LTKTALQGDFPLGKFNVTLDCFCGHWLTPCGEIPTLGPLEMVLGGMQKNPDVIPLKSVPSVWDMDPHLIYSSLGLHEFTAQTASRSVQPFLRGSRTLQTDRPRYSSSLI